MKTIISTLKVMSLTLTLVFGFIGCDSMTPPSDPTPTTPTTPTNPTNPTNSLAAPALLNPTNGQTGLNVGNVPISWQAVTNATEYELRAALNTTGLENAPTTKTTLLIQAIQNTQAGKTYYWQVRALNATQTSAWSSAFSFTVATAQVTPLSTPSGLSPSNGATKVNQPVVLGWNTVSGAISYEVQLATSQEALNSTSVLSVSTNTYTASNLQSATNYFWRVRSVRNAERSNWSDVFSFITSINMTPLFITPVSTAGGHGNDIRSISISSSQPYMISTESSKLIVWNLNTNQVYKSFAGTGFNDAHFLPNGTDFVTLLSSGVYFGNINQGLSPSYYKLASPDVLALSKNGQKIAVSVSSRIYIYDLTNPNLSQTPISLSPQSTSYIQSLSFSPDGRYLAASSADNNIYVWNMQSATVEQRLENHTLDVNAVAFSPDGKYLVSASDDKTIRRVQVGVWNSPEVIYSGLYGVISLAFSPNGNYLAAGDNNGIERIWAFADNKNDIKEVFNEKTSSTAQSYFSPNGRYFATGGTDNKVHLWEIK